MKENESTAIAVVANLKYLRKYANNFIHQVRTKGNFNGEIVIITSYFIPLFIFRNIRKDNKITVLRFNKIRFDRKTKKYLDDIIFLDWPNRNKTKSYQWNKIHLFDMKMKAWDYIFYLDINMNVHFDLNNIFGLRPKNIFYARADGYPEYKKDLSSQFDKESPFIELLEKNFDLSATNYFQTGVMYYDSSLITKDTKIDIINLAKAYPLSITNEQGIMNLYFSNLKNLYQELPVERNGFEIYYYWMKKDTKIIITKQQREKYK